MTPNQAMLYRFIRDYIDTHDGISPSYEEMRQHMGFKSTSGVYQTIAILEAAGRVRKRRYGHRSVEIVSDRCPSCGRAA